MKHVIASVTIGAWLLLPSAGIVLAADPHTVTQTKGQPGTVNGITCNTGSVGGGPGGSVNAINPSGTNGSPFDPNVPKTYSGNPGNPTGPGGTANNSPHAVSEYDVACFQAP
jgi:hypothetical protein